jgi:dihydroorotate dehydrogenase (fumarate)
MLEEIDQWMTRQDFSNVSDIIGMMSFREDKSMAAFERVQFMKHFSGIE